MKPLTITLAATLLPACDGCDALDGKTYEPWACDESVEVLSLDETSPIGIAGQDMLDAYAKVWTSAFEYTDRDTPTELTLTVDYSGGEVRFIDAEEPTDRQVQAKETGGANQCPDRIEVDVIAQLTTADGAFDEPLEVALWAVDQAWSQFTITIDATQLAGSWQPDHFDLADYDGAELDIRADFYGEPSGSMTVYSLKECEGEDCDGSCTDGLCEDNWRGIAHWPLR